MIRLLKNLSARCGQVTVASLLIPLAAIAHPLGQNAFNREAAIIVEPGRVQINYLLDLAEVPTLSLGEQADTNHDGTVTDTEWTELTGRWAQTLPGALVLTIDGKPLTLTLDSQSWRTAPGQAGLSTLRQVAHLSAPLSLSDQGAKLEYRDDTNVNRLGWKEIWISAVKGAKIVSADVPQQDRSKALTDFTPRAEGPPALITAHADIGLLPPGTVVDDSATAAAIAAADIQIDAKIGAERAASTDQSSPITSFFLLGIRHIAGGWDHLMFLLGLVLLSGNLRKLAFTVTAFTIAHSITLAVAAYGLAHPPPNWVEALVAATIAYVGAVALRGKKNNHGPVLAFGFGLIHGFGFAGALAESLGSGNELRLTGLLSFNLGIEAFQLSLVCLVVPVLRSLSRKPVYPAIFVLLASAVFLSGTLWFLTRTVGDGAAMYGLLAAIVISLIAYVVMMTRRGRSLVPSES